MYWSKAPTALFSLHMCSNISSLFRWLKLCRVLLNNMGYMRNNVILPIQGKQDLQCSLELPAMNNSCIDPDDGTLC